MSYSVRITRIGPLGQPIQQARRAGATRVPGLLAAELVKSRWDRR
ncbi:hypothetical protein [Streptomyces sp. NPDC058964]